MDFLCDEGLLIVLTDPSEGARAREHERGAEKRGFIIEKSGRRSRRLCCFGVTPRVETQFAKPFSLGQDKRSVPLAPV